MRIFIFLDLIYYLRVNLDWWLDLYDVVEVIGIKHHLFNTKLSGRENSKHKDHRNIIRGCTINSLKLHLSAEVSLSSRPFLIQLGSILSGPMYLDYNT